MAEFKGVFPAIITPMTADGEVNEAAFRQVIEFDIRAGVNGFWIAGGTGESILLTDEENMRLAEAAVDQIRGRATSIMHVGAASTAQAAKLAENAARAGVDAISCLPPFFYPVPDGDIVEHYRVVGAAADLPLFVYNLPQFTQVEITPELIARIRENVPQLVGLKHSSFKFIDNYHFAQMGLACFTGHGMLMLPALTLGASGCVDGGLGLAPEIWVEIWEAFNNGDLARAQAAQDRGIRIYNVLEQYGYLGAMKALIGGRLGIDCGNPRPPLPQLTSEQRARLPEEAVRLGLTKIAVEQAAG